jgi:dihydrolipoamide dehydrogenase
MTSEMRDLVVIGGGAGGVPAAIRAAQLGARVSIIEARDLGGQCMNRGCVPFGHMVEASAILGALKLGKEMGISFSGLSTDYATLMDRQGQLINFMRQGVESTLKKNRIEIIRGKGTIVGKGRVDVHGSSTSSLSCKTILLAVGASWRRPSFPGADLEEVVNSDWLLAQKQLPARVLLYGRSPWFAEIAQFLQRYGVKAILGTPEKRILQRENKTIAARLMKALKNEGVEVRTGFEINAVAKQSDGIHVESNAGKVVVDRVVTFERGASLDGLGIESLGLRIDREYLPVNERMETNTAGVYAIGDLTSPSEKHYSHLASQEGIIAAENAMGGNARINPRTLTRVLFTKPEVACVGLTEAQAKEEGLEVLVGAAPLSMNTRGMMIGESEGLVEVVAEKGYGEVLGVHYIGRAASEMAGQGVLAIQMEATLEDLARASFPHPTLSESLAEAARNALGRHIYLP